MLNGLLYHAQHHPLRFALVTLAIVLVPVMILTATGGPLP